MMVPKSAFTGKTIRVKWQSLVKLQVNNVSLDQKILISSQLVTPLLLGMDFCMDNYDVIDFPKRTIVINADDKESAVQVDLVNERRNINSSTDSPVTRAINIGTTENPYTTKRDRIVNPSNSDPPTLPGLEWLSGTLAGGGEPKTCPYGRPASELNRRPWTNTQPQGVMRGLP
jgi:hypothetical protein